jgi:hypothetical protein
MVDKSQGSPTSETRITVDMNAADPTKAVTRQKSDIGAGVRDDADTGERGRTKSERDLFKRMMRLEQNLTRQFDQRAANREAEWQREKSDLQQKIDKLSVDRTGDDAADAAHDAAIGVLKDKLAAAYEKGDSAASADITLQISKLDAQFWAKKATAAGVVQRETTDKGAAAAQPAAAARAGKGPTAAGSRFITANEAWWDDPDYEMEQAAANQVYLRLVQQEGFDPKDDETFKEVAKQVKAKFPKLSIRAGRKDPEDDEDDDDVRKDPNAGQSQRRAPAANIADRGDAGAGNRNRSTSRTLTAEEMKTMRDCRLDPENDRDVVQFLREAQALESAQS